MRDVTEKNHRAKKSLGQNFLMSERIAKIIAEAVPDEKIILEIGPGKGMLTKFLLEKNSNLLAIEKTMSYF